MSWRAWILLSLAWETSLSLVSAMAVKKGHRVSVLDVDGVSAQQPNCGTCDLADRDDTSLQPCCKWLSQRETCAGQWWFSVWVLSHGRWHSGMFCVQEVEATQIDR